MEYNKTSECGKRKEDLQRMDYEQHGMNVEDFDDFVFQVSNGRKMGDIVIDLEKVKVPFIRLGCIDKRYRLKHLQEYCVTKSISSIE